MSTPDYPLHRVQPGTRVRLTDLDPDATGGFTRKREVADELALQRRRISELQTRLYAEHRRALLIVLQAIDTGGKDGTIRGVFAGVNPQGCEVASFGVPSAEERDHDFLWRCHRRTPGRGMITIFNRSHYEDVLVVRVRGLAPESVWQPRYRAINDFERTLVADGTAVVKLFLHISRDEQKRRLEGRLADPDKRWKFRAGDLDDRALWDDHRRAFEEAIGRCSTPEAPWYVVPANRKWYRNLVVARVIADTLEEMDPRFPPSEPGLDGLTIPA